MATVHEADFVRVTEHGSEFFRVTCRETGATAMYWPSYLREGSPLAVWEHGECNADEHLNAKLDAATKARGKR